MTKNRTSSSVLSNSLDTPIHVAARYVFFMGVQPFNIHIRFDKGDPVPDI